MFPEPVADPLHDTGHAQRKQDHLRIVMQEPVASTNTSGLERLRLVHCALPEIDLDDVDTSATLLDKRLRAPLLISGMTGGVAQGAEINQRLAAAAQAHGCAMGVGSQRVALERPELEAWFQVRNAAPDILLLANIGAAQLNEGYGLDHARRAVEMIAADALVLHLNPLQEAVQSGGNTRWRGLLARIAELCAGLHVPVIAKEVGWGISSRVARQLVDAGVAVIDVGGAGGTSWSEVERHRAPDAVLSRVSGTFAGWGIPTAQAVQMARRALPTTPIIASGGLRSGIDAAVAIALGADAAGFAAPLLRAAAVSEQGAHDLLAAITLELRISMFCCGAVNLDELRRAEVMTAPC
ncbi:MAG: type 2 isopentenyl-diphosphate Delta-isomerase [Thermomicrobiales bacterium]